MASLRTEARAATHVVGRALIAQRVDAEHRFCTTGPVDDRARLGPAPRRPPAARGAARAVPTLVAPPVAPPLLLTPPLAGAPPAPPVPTPAAPPLPAPPAPTPPVDVAPPVPGFAVAPAEPLPPLPPVAIAPSLPVSPPAPAPPREASGTPLLPNPFRLHPSTAMAIDTERPLTIARCFMICPFLRGRIAEPRFPSRRHDSRPRRAVQPGQDWCAGQAVEAALRAHELHVRTPTGGPGRSRRSGSRRPRGRGSHRR
jgi:hypothetical protein